MTKNLIKITLGVLLVISGLKAVLSLIKILATSIILTSALIWVVIKAVLPVTIVAILFIYTTRSFK